jgi:hypothetical protein
MSTQHPTAPHLCGSCFYDKRDCVCAPRPVSHEAAPPRATTPEPMTTSMSTDTPCSCTYGTPCKQTCTCAAMWMSGGCLRCDRFGNFAARSPLAGSPPTTPERTFPIQGKTTHRRIPWWLAEEAYAVYSSRYGMEQSIERLAERGGFGAGELDMFIPGWRDRLDRVKQLEAENAELRAALAEPSPESGAPADG